jgi:hypothetical protein
MQRNPDRYPLYAQFAGMLYWTCPNCGHLNKTRLLPGRWTIRCSIGPCQRLCVLGLLLYHAPIGRQHNQPGDPPDAQITATPPTEHTNSEPTDNPQPMLIAKPMGKRKPYRPVHRTEPLPV